jgi:hypothetical protein
VLMESSYLVGHEWVGEKLNLDEGWMLKDV